MLSFLLAWLAGHIPPVGGVCNGSNGQRTFEWSLLLFENIKFEKIQEICDWCGEHGSKL